VYATEAMVDLAENANGGLVQLRDIAGRTRVSEGYLEQLLMPLRTAGLVRTVRGAHGGFTLGRKPSDITMGDIIKVVEGSMAPAECVDLPDVCSRSGQCATRRVWAKVKAATDELLHATTLADLVDGGKG
jgi:Rrf2 family protein